MDWLWLELVSKWVDRSAITLRAESLRLIVLVEWNDIEVWDVEVLGFVMMFMHWLIDRLCWLVHWLDWLVDRLGWLWLPCVSIWVHIFTITLRAKSIGQVVGIEWDNVKVRNIDRRGCRCGCWLDIVVMVIVDWLDWFRLGRWLHIDRMRIGLGERLRVVLNEMLVGVLLLRLVRRGRLALRFAMRVLLVLPGAANLLIVLAGLV